MLDVCLLGCGGMAPLSGRRLTSLMLRQNGKMVLVDCGEGTQIGIRMLGWGFKAIDALCITHYHADHIAGLPGFLLTLGNSGRTEPFTILGPPPLAYVISALTVIAPQLPFDIILEELSDQCQNSKGLGDLIVKSIPMDHFIPCLAYNFELRRSGKFDVERADAYKIPKDLWGVLQKGSTVQFQGHTLTPDMVTGPERKGLKVTYCTDTRPNDALIEFSRKSDLLILEGMYGDNALMDKAAERKHMVFSEAAQIAGLSDSKELWLTHFSPSLKEPQEFLETARSIFPNTRIGADLMIGQINFSNEPFEQDH
jgi:Metal-dependent hydrolases of the beta-lactamase superfamily III